jgi:hypothetical protein
MPKGKRGKPPEAEPKQKPVKLSLGEGGGYLVCEHEPACETADACAERVAPGAFGGTTHRVTTINSNGDLPTSQEVAPGPLPAAEAVRRAIEQLGEPTIDAQLAPQQMAELAGYYTEYARRKAEFDVKTDAAKTAKKGLEIATDLLLEKLRELAFPKPLPLFDAKQAEDDRQKMVAGGEVLLSFDGKGKGEQATA